MDNRTPLYVLLIVGVLFVLALAVFGSGSETSADSSASTSFADIDVPDPPPTTTTPTTSPRAVDVVPDVVTVADPFDPVLNGLERLIVVVGRHPDARRLVWIDRATGDMSEIALPSGATGFRIDSSGSALAYADADRKLRITTTLGSSVATPGGIAQFVWSGDEPLTAVWIEEDDTGGARIVLGRVEDDALVMTEQLDTASAPNAILRGATAAGWWVTYEDPAATRTSLAWFRSRSDETSWVLPADVVISPASGVRALLARLDITSWGWNFGLGAGDIRPLPWAPSDASGDLGFAALSPTGDRVAFIGSNDRLIGWLEVHSTAGGTARRLLLPQRVWDVRWSQRGDYVLMPGIDATTGSHVVVIAEVGVMSTPDPQMYAIEMDDRVQFAAVVDAARQTTSDTGPAGS